jgi:hypothetical protein
VEDARAQLLKRFLDQSSAYAATVVDPTENVWEDSTEATVAEPTDPAKPVGANSGERESKPSYYSLPPDLSSPRLYQPTAREQMSINEAKLRRKGLSGQERRRVDDKLKIAVFGTRHRWKSSGRKDLPEIEKLLDQGADPTILSPYYPGLEVRDKLLLPRGVICSLSSNCRGIVKDEMVRYLRNGARMNA